MSDDQDGAESVDEEMVGTDAVTSDEVGSFGDAPERPVGLPFADADVTDESLAERAARENPDVGDENESEGAGSDAVADLDGDEADPGPATPSP